MAALIGCVAGVLVARAQAGPPDCADGQTIRGAQGTPCADVLVAEPGADEVYGGGGDDTIYVPAGVDAVFGGGGDDRIYSSSYAAGTTVAGGTGDDVLVGHVSAALTDCTAGCHLGLGSQTFDGGPGDDVVYGERGNDVLNGNEGQDRLYGGIGDDTVNGGDDGDLLSGGWGGDSVDGEAGNDYVRGDGSADEIEDSGGGTDTLSYATGVAPGFPQRSGYPDFSTSYPSFPGAGGERGVYVDLGQSIGDNGLARFGGGLDTGLAGAGFENVIGTPFSDYIVGSSGANTIHGGGGGDVILAGGGNDTVYGGADGDDLDGGTGTNALDGGAGSDHCANPAAGTACESATNTGGVVLRDPAKISVGLLAPEDTDHSQVYLSGSSLADNLTATYAGGPPETVTFTVVSGSAVFDQGAPAAGGCSIPTATQAVCTLAKPLDSVVLYGASNGDDIGASSFPSSTSVVLAGGTGGDGLTGGPLSEDVLVDDPSVAAAGADDLSALGGDDAVLNNEGLDQLEGGDGNDLFLSTSVCDGDTINGGADTDNSSWARFDDPVEARISEGVAGMPGAGSGPVCGAGQLDTLTAIEDLEGSGQADFLYGGPGPNNLLGWGGADLFRPRAGDDRVFANAADTDPHRVRRRPRQGDARQEPDVWRQRRRQLRDRRRGEPRHLRLHDRAACAAGLQRHRSRLARGRQLTRDPRHRAGRVHDQAVHDPRLRGGELRRHRPRRPVRLARDHRLGSRQLDHHLLRDREKREQRVRMFGRLDHLHGVEPAGGSDGGGRQRDRRRGLRADADRRARQRPRPRRWRKDDRRGRTAGLWRSRDHRRRFRPHLPAAAGMVRADKLHLHAQRRFDGDGRGHRDLRARAPRTQVRRRHREPPRQRRARRDQRITET